MTTMTSAPRGGFGYRHPRMRLTGLLAAPMAWLVIIYLGSLAALFLTAFWSVDDFTGQLVKTFTMKNFQQVFTNSAYYGVIFRTLGIALLTTAFCMVLALPLGTVKSRIHRGRLALRDRLEGSMGLFDGVATPGRCGTGATADIAEMMGWPVLLVIDPSGQAQTAAALADADAVLFVVGHEIGHVELGLAGDVRGKGPRLRVALLHEEQVDEGAVARPGDVGEEATVA